MHQPLEYKPDQALIAVNDLKKKHLVIKILSVSFSENSKRATNHVITKLRKMK